MIFPSLGEKWNNLKPFIGTGGWIPITVPPEAKNLYCMLSGPGGNGGTGFSGIAGSARGGGGGGSSGGFSTIILPFWDYVPKNLYLYLPVGGQQEISHLSYYPDLGVSYNQYSYLSAGYGFNGGDGTVSIGGATGSAANTSDTSNSSLASLGIYRFFGGRNGGAGGTVTDGAGGARAFQASVIEGSFLCGGGGGGGVTSTGAIGGGIPSTNAEYPSLANTSIAANGEDGLYRLTNTYPLFSMPGAGGGSSNTGVGGIGGDGGPGSGGGGGGGGTTGGAGGKGGPAFALLSWG